MRIIRQYHPTEISNTAQQILNILEAVYDISPWSIKFIEKDLLTESSQYFLVEEDKQLIGFLAVQEMMSEIEITNLAVHPEFQGQKIATQLLEKLSDFSGTLFLEVRESNQPAIQLYEKFGFEVYHQRKNYYSQPKEDAILMRKMQ